VPSLIEALDLVLLALASKKRRRYARSRRNSRGSWRTQCRSAAWQPASSPAGRRQVRRLLIAFAATLNRRLAAAPKLHRRPGRGSPSPPWTLPDQLGTLDRTRPGRNAREPACHIRVCVLRRRLGDGHRRGVQPAPDDWCRPLCASLPPPKLPGRRALIGRLSTGSMGRHPASISRACWLSGATLRLSLRSKRHVRDNPYPA